MIRVLHVVTGLSAGGAESVLTRLASSLDRARFETAVVALGPWGPVGDRLRKAGVETEALGMGGFLGLPGALSRLKRILAERRPDLVQTWMYHADVIGGAAARRAHVPVVWNLRNGTLGPGTRLHTRLARRAAGFLSARWPVKIVTCSRAAAREHERLGYPADRFVHIPNGVDTGLFRPSPDIRAGVRAELNLTADDFAVGLFARLHPQKGHTVFLRALADLPHVTAVLAGAGTEALRDLPPNVRALGERLDVPRLMTGMDAVASASIYGEAFPNVLAEAMACGAPVVATDVGDSAEILGDTGLVVPAGDAAALAAALCRLQEEPLDARALRSQAARERVKAEYTLGGMVSRYEGLYTNLVGV